MTEHKPVMPSEVLEYLHITNKAWYLDATLGAGGHTIRMLNAGAKVIGIDADPKMLEIAKKNIAKACPTNKDNFVGFNFNFRALDKALEKVGVNHINGVLFDLGISSLHLDKDGRGFSFRERSAPLDMRLDPKTQNVKAADLLNALDQTQLANLFLEVVSKQQARKLAKRVVTRRGDKKFEKVSDLLELFPKNKSRLHPATTAFLALRIAVNTELEVLKKGLEKALDRLVPGGRIVVISFHSGEDRLVKNTFKVWQERDCGKILTNKPIKPSKNEVEDNPRARSAKLRSFKKHE